MTQRHHQQIVAEVRCSVGRDVNAGEALSELISAIEAWQAKWFVPAFHADRVTFTGEIRKEDR